MDSQEFQSWGLVAKAKQTAVAPYWTDEIPEAIGNKSQPLLAYGLGRSYGDVCLNDKGRLLVTRHLDRILSFDAQNGVIHCEAGVSLKEILDVIVPRGWFLPVSPGTKYVTVGGAIANDIHGKNHHVRGTFGCHVNDLELARSDGTTVRCARDSNADLFRATIGGMGLTGLITQARFGLIPVSSPWIDSETVPFYSLEEFCRLSKESEATFEYTVAWLDCLASGPRRGRGIFIRGNHAKGKITGEPKSKRVHTVRFYGPRFLLSPPVMAAFNRAFFWKNVLSAGRKRVPFDPFFYPLDAIHGWNKLYGRRGFFQYQFCVPFERLDVCERMLELISESRKGSFLVVAKVFGDKISPGLMSFPRPGITFALDFANTGDSVLRLMQVLDELVLRAGGRVYPAKDGRMAPATFQSYFPAWREFSRFVDPGFSSSFWRRVMGD